MKYGLLSFLSITVTRMLSLADRPPTASVTVTCNQNGLCHEKTRLQGFRPGPTQTRLYSHRWLEASNFGFWKKWDRTIYVAKTNALISCTITMHQGPVVQSIVSLTTSLRRQLVKYMPTKLSNTLLFFVGKM